ncbi:PREDICTED: uncharacterized protein LOC107071824 isoform X2 [Polistes dominula]|uniref:Chloride channel CLIC-like protein 1 n=1 Tax=Polistes dominula TaxID=743375 RepID=A0ABM1J2E7_POLDO|nr:PREDICTED: uncharacterized protein LOC107071824 isoform X2 [Polistes dominula]
MLKSIIFICIVIQCLINCTLVLCNEDNIIYSERDINDYSDFESKRNDEFNESMDKDKHEDDLYQVEDFIDPHSFFYDRASKKVIEDRVIFPKKTDKISDQEEECKKSIEDCERFKIYYVRLIRMLLMNLNLKMGTDDDLVEGHLFIKGTKMQIEKLQKVEIGDYSLKEIDLIFSEILLEPSLVDIVLNTINFNWIIQSVLKFVYSYNEMIIIASCVLAVIILCTKISYRRAIFFILVIGFTVSYTMTYLNLLREAEAEFFATQVKYTDMPVACKPNEMTFWERFRHSVLPSGNDECEKYYKARMSNPNYQVTPFIVLSRCLFSIIVQPGSLLGEALSNFINSSTAELPFILKYPMQVFLFSFLPILTVIGIILLRAKSIEFGPLRGLSCSFSAPRTNALPQDDTQKRQTIQLIREIIAELPTNIPKAITSNNDLPNVLQGKENDSPVDNSTEKSSQLMSDKSSKELNSAGGDTDLFSKESEKKTCKCGKNSEINKEIGGGDA